MGTGLVDSWMGNPADVGPMYPFVGFEAPLFFVCLLLWILYTIWQMKNESTHYAMEGEELQKSANPVRGPSRHPGLAQE